MQAQKVEEMIGLTSCSRKFAILDEEKNKISPVAKKRPAQVQCSVFHSFNERQNI